MIKTSEEGGDIHLDESTEKDAEGREINLDEQVQLYGNRILSLLKGMYPEEIKTFSKKFNDLLENEELSINISNLRKELEKCLSRELANEIIKRIEDSGIDIDWLINNVKFTDKGMEIGNYLFPYELENYYLASKTIDTEFKNNLYNIFGKTYFNNKGVIEYREVCSSLDKIIDGENMLGYEEYLELENLHKMLGKDNYSLPNWREILEQLNENGIEQKEIIKLLRLLLLLENNGYLEKGIHQKVQSKEKGFFIGSDGVLVISDNSFYITILNYDDYYQLMLIRELKK